MRKEFKEIKQFAKAMGFKNQKEFRTHVKEKRTLRNAYRLEQSKIDHYYSSKPIDRIIMRDFYFHKNLLVFGTAIAMWNKMPQSSHSSVLISDSPIERYVRYNKHRPLTYYDISCYRVGGRIILKSFFRGKLHRVEAKLPENWKKFRSVHPGLLRYEVGYSSIGGILKRYTYNTETKSFDWVGVAMELDDPFKPGEKYWEHGKTVRDCLDERDKKLEAIRRMEILKAENLKVQRKQRLIARLCNNIRVTFQDALDSGNCLVGVTNFVKHNFGDSMPEFSGNSFVNNRAITLGDLKKVNYSHNTEKVVEYVSMMVAQLSA